MVPTFKQFLYEARMAPLYHGTHMETLTQIIEQNLLKGQATHAGLTPGVPRGTPVISLTRKFNTAKFWRGGDSYGGVIELDQQKLSYNYKIKPVEIEYIWAAQGAKSHKDVDYRPKRSGLFEEFVVGDIKPLDRYLTAIHLTENVYKKYMEKRSWTTQFDFVLKHPLLKVDGKWINN